MASLDFAAFAAPVSAETPCGPDLDRDGDLDYMNFMARAEGLLPESYYRRDDEGRRFPFDRTTIDFVTERALIESFLSRSRDLRLFVIAAKFSALNRDLEATSDCLVAMASLISNHWDDVHPRAEDSDVTGRMVALQTLDDLPTFILPLQHMPLATSRRYGPISYRSKMVATGEAPPAEEGEAVASSGTIDAVLQDTDLPALVATRDRVGALRDAVARIRAVSVERAGHVQAVRYERLSPLADGMFKLLDDAVARRDPSSRAPSQTDADDAPAADGAAAGRPDAPGGAVTSVREAAAALAAAGAYFVRAEPSNPAAVVIRQAEQLIGKSFVDVVRILFPNDAERTTIRIGEKPVFGLSFDRLASLDEGSGGDRSGDGNGAGQNEFDEAPEPPVAANREQAIKLLKAVGSYFRAVEPSSPIPLLTDRVCGFAHRDFLNLITDVLPGVGVELSGEAE